jgi:hypothetical protein
VPLLSRMDVPERMDWTGGGEEAGRRNLDPGAAGGAWRRALERTQGEEDGNSGDDGVGRMIARAKATWGRLKGMFVGKKLVMDERGGGRVREEG